MALWQEGIQTVYMIDDHGTLLFDSCAKERFDLFVEMSNIKIERVTPDLSWIKNLCGVL
jgi:hypothetical protein